MPANKKIDSVLARFEKTIAINSKVGVTSGMYLTTAVSKKSCELTGSSMHSRTSLSSSRHRGESSSSKKTLKLPDPIKQSDVTHSMRQSDATVSTAGMTATSSSGDDWTTLGEIPGSEFSIRTRTTLAPPTVTGEDDDDDSFSATDFDFEDAAFDGHASFSCVEKFDGNGSTLSFVSLDEDCSDGEESSARKRSSRRNSKEDSSQSRKKKGGRTRKSPTKEGSRRKSPSKEGSLRRSSQKEETGKEERRRKSHDVTEDKGSQNSKDTGQEEKKDKGRRRRAPQKEESLTRRSRSETTDENDREKRRSPSRKKERSPSRQRSPSRAKARSPSRHKKRNAVEKPLSIGNLLDSGSLPGSEEEDNGFSVAYLPGRDNVDRSIFAESLSVRSARSMFERSGSKKDLCGSSLHGTQLRPWDPSNRTSHARNSYKDLYSSRDDSTHQKRCLFSFEEKSHHRSSNRDHCSRQGSDRDLNLMDKQGSRRRLKDREGSDRDLSERQGSKRNLMEKQGSRRRVKEREDSIRDLSERCCQGNLTEKQESKRRLKEREGSSQVLDDDSEVSSRRRKGPSQVLNDDSEVSSRRRKDFKTRNSRNSSRSSVDKPRRRREDTV